jgi:hypothetical protein
MVEADQAPPDEAARTAAWRYEQLLRLGIDPVLAWSLRHQADVVHEVSDLIERGCSPQIAGKIVG